MKTVQEMLAGGEYVSGEKISRELGITRAAVWKRIEALRAEGWQIESGGRRGYRLIAGDSLQPALWTGKLTTKTLGRGEIRYAEETDSTNTQVKAMALAGAPSGSLCLAECQTAGRGRLGRAWSSPAGEGLWFSLLLRPNLPPHQAPVITLCTAVAMAKAVRQTCGIPAEIKWPNDLVAEGKKLCGILLEMAAEPDRIEYVVVGTGLNVHAGAYPPELKGQAVSLSELKEDLPPRRDILTAFLAEMEQAVTRAEEGGFAAVEPDYTALSCTLGRPVRVCGAMDFTGTAEALDETGALLVRDEAGELRRVLSGDVSVRGLMGYV